jgi:hypothetical protein
VRDVDWIKLFQDNFPTECFEYGNESSGFRKGEEFPDELSDYQFLSC